MAPVKVPNDDQLKAQLEKARARAAAERASPHRVVEATHEAGYISVHFANGYRFGIPVGAIPGLAESPASVIRAIEIDPLGQAIRWDALDIDVSVPGLLVGALGSKALFAHLGSIGGSRSTEQKRKASKTNGLLGGRPRKARVDSLFAESTTTHERGYGLAAQGPRARKAAAKKTRAQARKTGGKALRKAAPKKAKKAVSRGARKRAK